MVSVKPVSVSDIDIKTVPIPKDFIGYHKGSGMFEGEPRATEYYYHKIQRGEGRSLVVYNDTFKVFTATEQECKHFSNKHISMLMHTNDTIVLVNYAGFISMLVFSTDYWAESFLRRKNNPEK